MSDKPIFSQPSLLLHPVVSLEYGGKIKDELTSSKVTTSSSFGSYIPTTCPSTTTGTGRESTVAGTILIG